MKIKLRDPHIDSFHLVVGFTHIRNWGTKKNYLYTTICPPIRKKINIFNWLRMLRDWVIPFPCYS